MKNTKGLVLILLLLVITGPLLFAWILVQKNDARQFRLNNHGDLISPVQNINQFTLIDITKHENLKGSTLNGKWWLVYVAPKRCQEECHSTLYNMRQIRTALGKESNRLDRLFIARPDCPQSLCETFLNENYPDMRKVTLSPADFSTLLSPLGDNLTREMVGELYLIDPKGNAMMHFSIETPAKDILTDIKRLLRVSK